MSIFDPRAEILRPTPTVQSFTDASTGFSGWRVPSVSGRSVPTPAVADGRIFVGGGFGSYDFHAFDAQTGFQLWHRRTTDDGPTAAVVSDGLVAYNTESCTLEIVDATTGNIVWHKWLGDPLLAQPAIMDGRVFMAFPRSGQHWLGAFSLKDGKALWETRIDHDVITAPVGGDGLIFLSTLDGTVWCLDPDSGKVKWSQQMHATSAPWIWQGDVFVAHRDKSAEDKRRPGDPSRTRPGTQIITAEPMPSERTSRFDSNEGRHKASYSSKEAAYLDARHGSAHRASFHAADDAVGFGHSPQSAKLGASEKNIGEKLVSRTWRFQGSRPVVVDGILYDTTGDRLEASDARTGEVLWSWRSAKELPGERRLTPPAVANGRVWAGTWDGRILSWDAGTGKIRWAVEVGAPCHWQPVVYEGWVYAGLENGTLIGFATGDPKDSGWPMWGGGCGHNGQTLSQSGLYPNRSFTAAHEIKAKAE